MKKYKWRVSMVCCLLTVLLAVSFSFLISAQEQQLSFTSLGNGTCAVSDIGDYRESDLEIPEYSPAGELVVSIGNDAFRGCKFIEHVSFPEGLQSIGDRAFYGCSALTSITFPSSLKSVGSDAFTNCSLLTDVLIPLGVEQIGNNCFKNCDSLTTVTFPESVTKMGTGVFYGCVRSAG